MYLGALLATGGLIVVAYRPNAAWREARSARYSMRTGRKLAWSHTVRLAAGVTAVIVGLLIAGFELAG
ncbi:hypothetical protein [Actinoplanes aureus]|uniref:Uncharacterized protein n=1 Tax=Actinoplanes aureus TaxID=2792083 RepID=A0A931C429_9ACTN|nr:hypothetical protein [Actinoplanes aureus]MBG0560063.1 hypothetical protein [Actinoplanes aureus]